MQGGTGTALDPFRVANYTDLLEVGRSGTYPVTDSYILVADIDASPSQTTSWTTGGIILSGHLDGQGYKISDLTISAAANNQGFFYGTTADGVIENIFFEDVSMATTPGAGNTYLAAIVSTSHYGTIRNCGVSGVIHTNGTTYIAGLANYCYAGSLIEDCYCIADITSTDATGSTRIGGIASRGLGTVQRCYYGGTLTKGSVEVGGIVGDKGGTITDCFWDSTKSATGVAGGGTAKTTAEMAQIATYTNWDIEAIADYTDAVWFIDDSYPGLYYQVPAVEGFAVTYLAGQATTGTVPSDATVYQTGNTVTVLGNTGSLQKVLSTFAGWSLTDGGSAIESFEITADTDLYPVFIPVIRPAGKIIDQTNYLPTSRSDAEIIQAAGLDTYFEHASVGVNIRDGLIALRTAVPRYTTGGITADGDQGQAIDPAWFLSNNGLADVYRGYPVGGDLTPAEKREYFDNSIKTIIEDAAQVSSFKYCYIDYPNAQTPQQVFDATLAIYEGLEALYPNTVFLWWTMPLTNREDRATARIAIQAYNELVRAYCTTNSRFLLDIADLESHDPDGNPVLDTNGNPNMYSGYTYDNGHLNETGAEKIALAYWETLSVIANDTVIPVETFNVTYLSTDSTGGTVPTDSTDYADGATVTVAGNTGSLARTGYTFGGWALTNGVAAVTSFQISADTSLYPVWVAVPVETFNVTYLAGDATGGTVPVDSNDYESGDTVTVLSNPGSLARTGYTFDGWSTTESGVIISQFIITADTSLYPQWEEVTTTFDSVPGNFTFTGRTTGITISVSGA